MKIIVAGGTGAMAHPGIIYLLEQSDVTELVIADLDMTKIEERILQLNDPRLSGTVIDLSDVEGSANAFMGADVVYNCAYFDTAIQAIKAALEAGTHYVDLGAPEGPEQLKFFDAFKAKGLTAILGCGTAPGMSCIMPAYAVEKLDSVESIHIKDVCSDMVPHSEHSRPLYWGYSIDSILMEFTEDAQILEDGEIKFKPPRWGKEVVEFLPPAGTAEIAVTNHPEVEMFYSSWKDKGLKEATWKIGFEPEFEQKMQFLSALGFGNNEPIDFNGNKVSPLQMILYLLNNQKPEENRPPDFRGHMIAFVTGMEKGKKVEYKITEYATGQLTEKMQTKGVYSSYRTGLYGAIGTIMVARGQIDKKGVFYPEIGIDSEGFLKEADRSGINITISRNERI